MANRFPPVKDADLLSMSANLATKISATPTVYGLSALIASAFAALQSAYADAYALAIDPATRTKPTITAKDTARTNLIGSVNGLRDVNRFVQATRSVSDAQKDELGLPVYAPRTPIPAPSDVPILEIVSTTGRRTKINLRTAGSEGRGRPKGVQGILVLSYQGEVPPSDITLYKTEGMTTRTSFEIVFAPTIPAFTRVWLTAAFYSPRGQAGPACEPVSVFVGNGVGTTQEALPDAKAA